MVVALSGQITIIVDPSVFEFEGMIHRFEVTATGMNACGVGILTWKTGPLLLGHS